MLGRRAVQIGMKGDLSEFYVRSALSVEDVTGLARRVGAAHAAAQKKTRGEAAGGGARRADWASHEIPHNGWLPSGRRKALVCGGLLVVLLVWLWRR